MQVRLFLEGKSAEIDVNNMRQVNAIFSQFRHVVAAMETEMSSKLKQKFVLIEKNNVDAMTAIQRVISHSFISKYLCNRYSDSIFDRS